MDSKKVLYNCKIVVWYYTFVKYVVFLGIWIFYGQKQRYIFKLKLFHLFMNQKQVWDKIAPEWHEFKTNPSESATEFLNDSKGKILDFGSGSGRNLLGLKKNKFFF